MPSVRLCLPFLAIAALAACSGNLGGGQSTLPGMPQGGSTNTQQYAAPTPTASPVSASNVATIGDSVAAQPLPQVMGFGGSIAFAKPVPAPSPSPNPKSTPLAGSGLPGNPITIGITAGIVEPSDAPHFGAGTKGKRAGKRSDGSSPVGVLFISLLATADVTLGEYPKIAVDVPRDVAAKYHDRAFGLALFDPETKGKSYQLDVAGRDLASPAPGSAPTPAATPTIVPTILPSGMPPGGASAFGPPPIGMGPDTALLPPDRIAFLGTAATLTLHANRPVVFALYVAPASPSPSPSASATPSPLPSPSPSPSASASGSMPTSVPSPGATPSPAPIGSAAPHR